MKGTDRFLEFSITDEEFLLLSRIARAFGTSKRAVARAAIAQYLATSAREELLSRDFKPPPESKLTKLIHPKTDKPICFKPHCGLPAHGRGLCSTHYAQFRRGRGPAPKKLKAAACNIDGCKDAVYSRDFCYKHYMTEIRNPNRRKARQHEGSVR